MAKKLDSTYLKEQILADIRKLSVDGYGPSQDNFLRNTRWTKIQIWKIWGQGSWSEAVKEAGLTPNRFGSEAQSEDQLLTLLAEFTRSLGRFPTSPDFTKAAYDNNFPSITTFKKYLGNKPEMIDRLHSWISENPQYQDLVDILPAEANPSSSPPPKATIEFTIDQVVGETSSLSNSFIPPIIDCLPDMARNLPSIASACNQKNLSIGTEFKRRVAVAFELLGFSVERLGQGQGRKPDGIAKCFENHYAIIYDAKVRTTEFRLDAGEDRKFKEYVKTAGERLRQQGIKKIYFAVISSGFYERDIPKAKEICRQTEAKSCILMEADALVGLVENGLRDVSRFNSEKLEKIFADETRILRANHI